MMVLIRLLRLGTSCGLHNHWCRKIPDSREMRGEKAETKR